MAEKNPSTPRLKPNAPKSAAVEFDFEHLLVAAINSVVINHPESGKTLIGAIPEVLGLACV